jgi:hypothetical protein
MPLKVREIIKLFEADATSLWQYSPAVLPGLLQTEAYAREALIAGGARGQELERQVDARLGRRSLLSGEDAPHFRAIIAEAVFHTALQDTAAWQEQLAYLAEMADRPTVTLQVLPGTAGLHALVSTDVMFLRLPEGRTVAYTENDPATQISSTLTVSDIDDANLVSGSVAITSGHESSDDLSWADNNMYWGGRYYVDPDDPDDPAPSLSEQVALEVTPRGLRTHPVPWARSTETFEVELDFREHALSLRTSTGQQRGFPLRARPVAEFHDELLETLAELGIPVRIWESPV